MSKPRFSRVHWAYLPNTRFAVERQGLCACNSALRPKDENMTRDMNAVTCKSCISILGIQPKLTQDKDVEPAQPSFPGKPSPQR